jgi:hypothetical protein
VEPSLIHRQAKRVAIGCLIVALGSTAAAQQFGRNKVRYRSFEFKILKTEHFDVYYYSAERDGIEIAARLAERWYSRLERLFEHRLPNRQPLILYASHADFEQTNVVSGELTEGTGGLTEPLRRRIVLPLAGSLAETDHVIGHELVHAFQYDMTTPAAALRGERAINRLPLWFVEGMAEYLSLGRFSAPAAIALRDAVQRDDLPAIRDLSDSRYFPYHWGHALFAYVAGRYGDAVVLHLLHLAAAAGVERAINDVLGVGSAELTRGWHESIRSTYRQTPDTAPVTELGRRVTTGKNLGSELNIGPALSPDGRRIAFLSAESLFSIDLYVADVETGTIERKLTSTSSDSHYSSIQFIHSAGAWDTSSERIALATVVAGQPTLALFDVRTGKRTADIVLAEVDEILTPAWSPDGRAIAFSGMRHGLTDLYVYDLVSARLQRLTRDPFGDLHPAWSPDSTRLAFATERFSSNLAALDMGPLQLAIADVRAGEISPLPTVGKGKHINPQWSSDGQALYFVADPAGIPNIYRLWLGSDRFEQLTVVGTGVSGITASSPALSMSSGSGEMAFCVFENDRYDIYLADTAVRARPVIEPAAKSESTEGVLASLLANPDRGLPPPQDYPSEPYKASLSLEAVGQPSGGVGVGRNGVGASGGMALFFGDQLGDQMLAVAAQIDTGWTGQYSLNDITSEAGYFNLDHRWKWGVVGSQIPYLAGMIERGVAVSPAGGALLIDRQTVYRETQRSVSGIVAYPFNRSHRLELRGGFARTSFEQLVNATTYSETGEMFIEEAGAIQVAPRLDLTTSAVALVFDNANFGPVGPVQGQRYRLELSPSFGSIDFTGVLVDYRRYLMPVSFYTIAARIVHYGRYGAGSDDSRLYPVYVNDSRLVRGYDTFEYSTGCVHLRPGACQLNGRFAGSRTLVGNLELRFPLLRPFQRSRGMYGILPIELALFADSGVAWDGDEKPALLGGTREGISSAGLALRLNLGAAIVEFNFARPFQDASRDWVFGLNLTPGW